MAEPILSLCCMQMMCLVKSSAFIFMSISCSRHWFLHSAPVAFQLLDVSVWTPVLPFVYEAVPRQPDKRTKVTQSEEANIIACLYFYILYKP